MKPNPHCAKINLNWLMRRLIDHEMKGVMAREKRRIARARERQEELENLKELLEERGLQLEHTQQLLNAEYNRFQATVAIAGFALFVAAVRSMRRRLKRN